MKKIDPAKDGRSFAGFFYTKIRCEKAPDFCLCRTLKMTTTQEPNCDPTKRAQFGKEEQRNEREMTFHAKHKKSSQAICSLRRPRTGTRYSSKIPKFQGVCALIQQKSAALHRSRIFRFYRQVLKVFQTDF